MNVKRLFRQEIVHEPLLGSDDYRGDTFGPAQTIRARWSDEEHAVRSASGVDIVSVSVMSTLTPLTEGDRVTAPNGEKQVIVKVREARGVDGKISHYVGVIGEG